MNPPPIRVALVEDNARLREQLSDFIAASDGFACVAAFPTAEAALQGLPKTAPDVVLMDIELPKMSGVDCVARLRELMPEVSVVMLTVYDNSSHIFKALENGASGYLLKRTPPVELLRSIADVCHGGAPMNSHIARLVVQSFHRRGASPRPTENLTPREEEILRLVAKGFINKEIAEELGIALETVRQHLKNCYSKLHVRTRTEAAMRLLS
ncbi:MAG: DNA-binding response regulator [Verrucomicrobiales bacterium]|nr:DNA-binding response regulator [Verrucomicrobiales bacterium]